MKWAGTGTAAVISLTEEDGTVDVETRRSTRAGGHGVEAGHDHRARNGRVHDVRARPTPLGG